MTSDNKSVAFVLVPGSFATTVFYDKITPQLRSQGYTVKETPLLSAAKGDNAPQPPAKMEDDAAQIHSAISSLLDQGKNVVLVLHSYSGIPGTEAAKGLSKAARPDHPTALVGIVYIASFIPPVGSSSRDLFSEYQPEPYKSGLPGQYFDFNPQMGPAVFNDVTDPAEVQKYLDSMVNHSSDSFDGKVTYAAYKDIPSIFLLPEDDLVVPPKLQHELVDAAIRAGGKVKKVVVPGAGHCLNISQPELVLKSIMEAAGQQ